MVLLTQTFPGSEEALISVLDFQGLVYGSVLVFYGAVPESGRAANGGERAIFTGPPVALSPAQSAQTTVGGFDPVEVPEGTILAVLVEITFNRDFDPYVFLGLFPTDASIYVLAHCLRAAHVPLVGPSPLAVREDAKVHPPTVLEMRNYCFPMNVTIDDIMFGAPPSGAPTESKFSEVKAVMTTETGVGPDTPMGATNSIAVGPETPMGATNSIAVGPETPMGATNSIAVGPETPMGATNSIAVGPETATDTTETGVGPETPMGTTNSIAVGSDTATGSTTNTGVGTETGTETGMDGDNEFAKWLLGVDNPAFARKILESDRPMPPGWPQAGIDHLKELVRADDEMAADIAELRSRNKAANEALAAKTAREKEENAKAAAANSAREEADAARQQKEEENRRKKEIDDAAADARRKEEEEEKIATEAKNRIDEQDEDARIDELKRKLAVIGAKTASLIDQNENGTASDAVAQKLKGEVDAVDEEVKPLVAEADALEVDASVTNDSDEGSRQEMDVVDEASDTNDGVESVGEKMDVVVETPYVLGPPPPPPPADAAPTSNTPDMGRSAPEAESPDAVNRVLFPDPATTVFSPDSPIPLERLVQWMNELHQFDTRLFTPPLPDDRVLVQENTGELAKNSTPPPANVGTGNQGTAEPTYRPPSSSGDKTVLYGGGAMTRRRKRSRAEFEQLFVDGGAKLKKLSGQQQQQQQQPKYTGGNDEWSAFLYVFYQIGTIFSKLQFHPAMYYLRAVPDSDIDANFAVNREGDEPHQTSDAAVYEYLTRLANRASSASSPDLRELLLKKSAGRMHLAQVVDQPRLTALFEEFRSRMSIFILHDDAAAAAPTAKIRPRNSPKKTARAMSDSDRSLNDALKILTAPDAGVPEKKVHEALTGNYKDELSLFTLLFLVSDTPGFLDVTEKNSNQASFTAASLKGRQILLRAVAQRCMEILPVCSAMVELISGQSASVMTRLRTLAQGHTQSLLGTFLYLRVDKFRDRVGLPPDKISFDMNARYKVAIDPLELKRGAANRSVSSDSVNRNALRTHHESLYIQYNDDDNEYYDPKTGAPVVETPEKKAAREAAVKKAQDAADKAELPNAPKKKGTVKSFMPPPAPTASSSSSSCPNEIVNVPKLIGNKNTGGAPNHMTFDSYDRRYVLGPFSQIFGPTTTPEAMAKDMTVALDALSKGRPVMIMGYGASGAGKTSALVYFKPKKQAGVVVHLCNMMMAQDKAWNTIRLVVHEMYALNHDVLTPEELRNAKINTNIAPTHRRIPSKDGQYLAFQFDTNSRNYVLDGDKAGSVIQLPVVHGYRFDSAEQAAKEARFTMGSSTLGDVLVHLIDADRFTKSTPNNPQSSRSHVVALLTFVHQNTGAKSLLALGDFAGMENEFSCSMRETLAKLGAPKRSWKNEGLIEENDDTVTRGGSLALSVFDQEFTQLERTDFWDKLWGETKWEAPSSIDPIKYNAAMTTPMNLDDPVSKYLKFATEKGTVADLGQAALKIQLRRVPLPMPIDKVFTVDTLKQILDKYFVKCSNLRKCKVGFYHSKLNTIVDWLNGNETPSELKEKDKDIAYAFGGMLLQLRTSMKQFKVKVGQNLPSRDTTTIFMTGMLDAIEMSKTIFKQSFFDNNNLSINLELLETMAGATNVNKMMENNAVLRPLLDAWWDPDRYTDTKTIWETRNSPNTYVMNALSEEVLTNWETIRWIRHRRFRVLVLKHMCYDRRAEGSYINRSVGHLRDDIQTLVDVKCAATSTPPIPPILPDLVSNYCPAYSRSCLLPAAAGVGFVRAHAPKPASDMLNVVFHAWLKQQRKDNSELTSEQGQLDNFYEQLYPCIFCVANLSRKADNPPPTPYIDSTNLRLLVGEFRSVLIGDWRQDFNKPPPILVLAAPEELKSKLKPMVDVDKAKKRGEFKRACIELVCRIRNRYKRPGVVMDQLLNDICRVLTAMPETGSTLEQYTELHKLAVVLIEKLDIANASSTMGTLEFLDRSAKYNRTNVMATDIMLLRNEASSYAEMTE